MNSRKVLTLLGVLVVVFGIAIAGNFYWNNLRGAGPAIKPPVNDITTIINTTQMPLSIPKGFSLSIFAKNLDKPRVLAWDPSGTLVVSIPSEGKVVALPDSNKDGVAEAAITIAEKLNAPHGLAFRSANDGNHFLYIAETHQLVRYSYDVLGKRATNPSKLADLPRGGSHTTRTILRQPTPEESEIYISIGSSCNVCNEDDDRRTKILKWTPGGISEFARGLRNAVFMVFHPKNGKIYATEMGRDLLGDDIPPDEINIIEEGKNYGWPICYGKNIHDTQFDKNTYIRNPCMEPFETPSLIDLQAHSAPLGLRFVPEAWSQYADDLLVSYHGSWNRSVPTGYKIVRHIFDKDGNYEGVEDFISGWITKKGKTYGRPVDLIFDSTNALYISDDKAGVIYKMTKL